MGIVFHRVLNTLFYLSFLSAAWSKLIPAHGPIGRVCLGGGTLDLCCRKFETLLEDMPGNREPSCNYFQRGHAQGFLDPFPNSFRAGRTGKRLLHFQIYIVLQGRHHTSVWMIDLGVSSYYRVFIKLSNRQSGSSRCPLAQRNKTADSRPYLLQ